MSASDKAENTAQDLKGKAKEALGKVTNDDSKVAEGRADQAGASAQEGRREHQGRLQEVGP